MTEPENNITPFEEIPSIPADKPKLYSKRVIRIFSIFFSTLAGGILLRQNLKDTGNNKAAFNVLIFSILYTLGSIVAANLFPAKFASPIALILNIIGSFILNEYFFQKAVKDADSYPTKSFWKPLIIWLLICAVFLFIIISGGGFG